MEVETFWDVKIEKIGMNYYSPESLTASLPLKAESRKVKDRHGQPDHEFQGKELSKCMKYMSGHVFDMDLWFWKIPDVSHVDRFRKSIY